jgi:hypothetical protein
MTDVDTLFSEYIKHHRDAGEANPTAYLERVDGGDRKELAALIDGYLARSPGKSWDPVAFEGSPAAKVTEAIAAKWDNWELRDRAKLKRAELVARLAEAIGAPGQEQKVAAYYHQMEIGALPSEGVSDRVLGALSALLSESAEKLRAAGSVISAGGDRQEVFDKVAFARTAIRDPAYADAGEVVREKADSPGQAAPAPGQAEDLDEVDRLFTGGADTTS